MLKRIIFGVLAVFFTLISLLTLLLAFAHNLEDKWLLVPIAVFSVFTAYRSFYVLFTGKTFFIPKDKRKEAQTKAKNELKESIQEIVNNVKTTNQNNKKIKLLDKFKKPDDFMIDDSGCFVGIRNGENIPINIYSIRQQQAMAVNTYFTKGPEFAANAIKGLPVVKEGKTTSQIIVHNYLGSIIDHILADNYFSEQEEKDLNTFFELTKINQSDLKDEDVKKILKAKLVRDLINGDVHPVMQADSSLPIILKKKEILIWGDNFLKISTLKSVRKYVAGSRGVSIRIAKGIYYRTGGIKGHSESQQVQTSLGYGLVAVTNMNVFIQTSEFTKKIPLSKLISVVPYKNEIEINCENNAGKPIFIETNDPYFWANIMSNAINWAE